MKQPSRRFSPFIGPTPSPPSLSSDSNPHGVETNLRFTLKGIVYQFKVLYIDLLTTPRVFTRVCALALVCVHQKGIIVLIYIYMYVCMYVCMYICMYVCMHLDSHHLILFPAGGALPTSLSALQAPRDCH